MSASGQKQTFCDYPQNVRFRGTGYSSLAYLKRLPIQKLKIDKSFVDNLVEDTGDLAIAESIISLGHNLGLDVIAEGVESWGQADVLLGKGCDEFQGYLFSKPLPADEIAGWFLARSKGYEEAGVKVAL